MPVSIREKGEVVIVDLSGEIRVSEAFFPSLKKLIGEQLSSGKKNILLNFENVEFIDSYGIGDILAAHTAVREKKGKLKLAHLSHKIWLIFNYSGLTRILEIFDSEDEALNSFR
jgi:anti-anti-sigma factor